MVRAAPLPVLLLLASGLGAAACGPGPDAPDRTAVESRAGARPPAPAGGAPGAARDVLLVTIDTLRADALGFAGNPRAETPVLDRLAAAGRTFTNAHAHNVVTLPSHANILTGRLPFEHGIRDNSGFVLPDGLPTAATLFQDAGFATAAVVGAFPLDARFGLARGFDLYDDRYPEGSGSSGFHLVERRGDEVVEAAAEWWESHAGERRFLWVHLFDPHAPYEPPEPFASRFPAKPYLGEVAAVDSFLAPLLEPPMDGAEEPVLIVFTSDHGEALGDHGELTHGLFAYESTLRVPLVLWGPGVAAGETPEAARHVDLLPTMLHAAGVEPPGELPGRSLLAPPPQEPPATYFEALTANLTRGWAPLRGVIEEGRKLISLPIPEYYDLGADPGESENLYDAHRRRARELASLLPEESTWPPRAGDVSAEEAAALRSLGYLAGSAPAKASYTAEDDPKSLVEVDRKVFRMIDLYQRGELEEATELGREVIRLDPEMADGYYLLAQVLLQRGRAPEALEVLQTAHRRGSAHPGVTRQLALLLAEAGRHREAAGLLEPVAAEGDPADLNALGKVLAGAGRHAEARAALEKVFDRDPRNPDAHQNLALVALQSERWQEAARQAGRALELNEGLPLAWNYLGVARYNLEDPRGALEAWERALRFQPDEFDVLLNLALVSAEVGDVARARRALERFVREAPPERYAADLPRARELLGRLSRAG